MDSTKTLFYASAVQPNPNEVLYWIDLKRDPYGNSIKSFDGSINKWVLLNYDSTIYRVFDLLGIPYDKETGEASWPNLGEGSVFGGDTLVDGLKNANAWATNLRDKVGKPGGLTPLNDQGQVDAKFLPSYVDDVVDVYATYNTDVTGAITNIQLWKNKECTVEITAALAEKDKIYVDVAPHKPNGDTIKVDPAGEEAVYPSYQFRWSGSQWVWINGDHLIIGDITGTAFDGGKGHHLEAVAKALPPTILTDVKTVLYAPEYVRVPFDQYNKSDLDVYSKDTNGDHTDIQSASETQAGVMPAYLYQFTYDIRNTLPDHLVTGIYLAEANDNDITILTQSANKKSLTELEDGKDHAAYDKVPRNDRYVEEHKEDTSDHKHLHDLVIPAVSAEHAGVLTKTQFAKFDTEIPAKLEAEIERSKLRDNELTTKDTILEGRLGRLEHELDKEWKKKVEELNTARLSIGLDDHNLLPDLKETHYLKNINDDDVEDDNVSSLVGCVTKLDDELHKLSDKVDDIPIYTKEKGQPNGLAELGEDGKVKTALLPGFVDDVIDVYALFEISNTGKLSNIKLYTDKEKLHEVQGEVGKIYINITEGAINYQFRWTGTLFAHVDSNALILGTITGTAYDGGDGNALKVKSDSLPKDILSNFTLTLDNPDNIKVALTGKTFDETTKAYVDAHLTDITINSATTTVAGLMSKTDKAALDKAVTDIAHEAEERRNQDNKHSEDIGALRKKAKEVDEEIKAKLTELESQITDWESKQTELSTKVETNTTNISNLETKLSEETTQRLADIADQRGVDGQLREADTQLDRKIDNTKAELQRSFGLFIAQTEADLGLVLRETQQLKEADIRHEADIDDLEEADNNLAEEIKSLAELVGLQEKEPPVEEGGDEFELPEEENPVMIGEASSVFDAVEKLDKGAVPWTKEPADDEDTQKKFIDLPLTSLLRGTIPTKEKDTATTKTVSLAGISEVNVGYFENKDDETELPKMQLTELGNTDIHSELKSNDRPTVEVIEKVQKYTDNTKKAIANAVATGVMPASEVSPIAETLTTTTEHHHKHVAYSQDELWYGVRFDLGKNNGVYDGVRTGNLDMHRELPIQSKMRGCVIQDNGDTIKYLKADDWKKYEDGTDVQDDESQNKRVNFFVEIPEHYRLFLQTPDNNVEIRISEYNIPGYVHVEKKYIGAYEATTDYNYSSNEREEAKNSVSSQGYKTLWSRPNWLKPEVNCTRQAFQNAARKSPDIVTDFEGHARSNHWNMYTYGAHVDITWLFVVEYATLNSLKDFKKALTPEGYHQGGLGAGVTKNCPQDNVYSWIPAGVTHTLGSNTGIVIYTKDSTTAGSVTMPEQSSNGDFEGGTNAATKTEVPRYRGIENPFGHVWKNTVDVVVTGDGAKPHNVYVCKDYTKFSDSIAQTIHSGLFTQDGYELQPFTEINKNGYLTTLVGTNYGDLFAKECNGLDTTYYADYHYTYTTNGSNVAHTLLIGGRSVRGAYAGLFCLSSDAGVGKSYAIVGTRLTFYGEPNDTKAAAAKAMAYASQPRCDLEYGLGMGDEESNDMGVLSDSYAMSDDESII